MARYRLLIFDFDGTLADSAAWFFAKYDKPALIFRTLDEIAALEP